MEQGWRTALTRWGDELWRVAFVRMGDRAAAQQALVQAFERVFRAATPPSDPHTALIQALVPRRHRWLPRVAHQRALPRPLRRINPADRVVLALWLAHEHDGARLARVSQVPQSALVPRLVAVLLPFLPRRDTARRTPAGRAVFAHWVGQQLGIGAAPLPDTLADDTMADWQQAVGRVRDLFTTATMQQRLPASCRDAIGTALTVQADETPAWQRRAGWFAVALLVLAIGWILRPTLATTATTTTAAPQRTDPRTVVQAAIDGWTTMPVSGTLHRRVWALDTRPGARNPALVTDVWLPSDGEQYRVETTHDGNLDEWHVVDSRGQLHMAAELVYNMCQWSYGPSVPAERRVQIFNVPSAQVRAVRAERLRSGTYGEGYRMLRRALQAPDLGSYGVRTEHERLLLTLGFRDHATTPARTILLVLDARTNELQTVRELAGDAAQTTARDLWRLDAHETVPTVPTALPRWDGKARTSSEIIDPACPELERSNVISLRRMVAMSGSYGGTVIPTPLPSNVTHAAFVTPGALGQNGFQDVSGAQLVLRSADGWLRIRNPQTSLSDIFTSQPSDVRRGHWVIRFTEASGAEDPLGATIWEQPPEDASSNPWYGPMFNVETLGWTREEMVDAIERLQMVNEQTWPTLAQQFLDPQPLPGDVQQVLAEVQQTLHTFAPGTLHVVLESRAQDVPQQPQRDDPYHVPQNILAPPLITLEQWATIGDAGSTQFKQVATGQNGTLLSALVNTPMQSSQYSAAEAQARQYMNLSQSDTSGFFYGYNAPGLDLVRPLLLWDAPVTMTADDDLWRFEQVLPLRAPELATNYIGRDLFRNDALGNQSYLLANQTMDGAVVQRVWLDRAQLVPRRWELVHRTADGETVLRSIAVREWRMLPAPPTDEFWALPTLPPDTLVQRSVAGDDPATTLETAGGPLGDLPPKRALVWKPDSGLVIKRDDPYHSLPEVQPGMPMLETLMYHDIDQAESFGLVRTTTYAIPNTTTVITLRQGPRALLRNMLRRNNGSFGSGYVYNDARVSSRQIEVTIANQQHEAWLLRNNAASALVVEIDDVLLYIQAPEAYLDGVLLEQLPALQWEDVSLVPSGGAIDVQP